MAQSLLVESKKSNLRVSDQFAEVAKIKGSAEEHLARANAQAANIQANAKVRSIEKWQGVTEKLSNHFSNKATEGRIEAGKKKGQEIVKKAMETNSFVPRYESEENILGFGKGKRHDEEANKSIDAYNSLLLANTINSAYNQANSEALVPENRQAVMDNLHGVYGGLVEKLEEMGNDDLAINARFLAAEKLQALNNDMAKRQFAEMGDKMKGGLISSMTTDPTATSVEQLKQQEAAYRLADEEIRGRTGSGVLTSVTGINRIQARREATFDVVSQKIKMGGIENILPQMDEMADPTTATILTDDSIKVVEDELERVGEETAKAALAIGVQYTPEDLTQLRYDTLGGVSRLLYENSINLEEHGLVAGGKYDTKMVDFILTQEKDKGEFAIAELSGLISDPVARSEWVEKQNDELHKFVNNKKETLYTENIKKENTRLDALQAPVKSSLMPASNIFASTPPEELPNLDDDEFKHYAIYDISGFLYGQRSGLKPAEGEYEAYIVNRMNQLGFEPGSREFKEYRAMAWKRYNSTIAPFSEQARANGYSRRQTSVGVPMMDGDNVLFDEGGNMKMTSMVLDENSIITLSKNPEGLQETMISIQADPNANEHFVDLLRQRNNQVPFSPNSNLGKMAYAGIAGIPFTEEMQAVNVSRNTAFTQSIADSTGLPMLDSQSYYFLRNLGNRSEQKADATEDAGAYIDYTSLDKIDLDSAFSRHGIFLPLTGEFEPATDEDFNRVYGENIDSITDILASDPRAILSSGEIDDDMAEFIKGEFDKWSFLGMGEFGDSGIKVVPIKHENGFSKIHYKLINVRDNIKLPGVYTIDLSGLGR